jgi:amino acid transporter
VNSVLGAIVVFAILSFPVPASPIFYFLFCVFDFLLYLLFVCFGSGVYTRRVSRPRCERLFRISCYEVLLSLLFFSRISP